MTRPGCRQQPVPARAEDFDQVSRKRAFQARHPEVFIGLIASATWQARIPEENGETILTRWYLRELMDELDSRYPPACGAGTQHRDGLTHLEA